MTTRYRLMHPIYIPWRENQGQCEVIEAEDGEELSAVCMAGEVTLLLRVELKKGDDKVVIPPHNIAAEYHIKGDEKK